MSKSLTASDSSGAARRFATTRWSIVLAAGERDATGAEPALATLCEIYWYPVYAFIRRRGLSPADAQDATQSFFAALLEKDYVGSADPERGRFRTFLLTAVSRFLSRQRESDRALKRGGGRQLLSIDAAVGEERYQLEPSDDWTPERLFERRWALTLLDRVLTRLEQRYAELGQSPVFNELRGFLTGAPPDAKTIDLAAELQMTEGALKVAIHRLRRRYRDLLKAEIAETVGGTDDVTDELNCLLGALRGGEK
jgi:RNA polymerase sigma-70 factor (ECF subfamily)